MPWTPQGGGGGPLGGGGGGPWGRGSGPQPPDLEELLRRGQDRFRQVMPGGFGNIRGIALVLVGALIVWIFTGIYFVRPDEQGIVLRFGRWVDSTGPGMHYHLPSPIERVLTPKVTTVNRVELGYRSVGQTRGPVTPTRDVPDESLMLTGDENIVDIDFSVFWLIKDAGQYLFNLREPDGTVKIAAESAMREIVGQTAIQSALTEGRQDIENRTKVLLQKLLDDYQAGITVTQVQLLKVDPPAPVVDAFNDVQRAKADQERLRNEAEGYRNDVIPRARGEAERLIQEAEAYREQVVNLAQGDAARFVSVYNAWNENKEVTGRRLYLETMEEVLRGANKVIVDPAAAGQAGGVVPYLPLPELRSRPPTATSQPQQPSQTGGGR